MPALPPLNALRAFEAAARNASFKKAADELCVTEGAVSRQVKTLEDHLGVKLFIRLHRGVELSREGRLFFRDIHESFKLIARSAAAFTAGPDANTLKVKLAPTPAIWWLVPRLAEFHASHGDITVQVTTSHDPVDFAEEDIDIGICYGRPDGRQLVIERLFREVLIPVCSKAVAERGDLHGPGELAGHVLLHSLRRPDDWERWFEVAGLGPIGNGHRRLVMENSALIYQGAAEGLGLALAQVAFVGGGLAMSRLAVPFDIRLPGQTAYYMAYPAYKQRSRKVSVFHAWLARQAAETRRLDPNL